MEILDYFEKTLKEYPIIYLNLPSGLGRTYILKSLYSKNKEISLFTCYASHRTPLGEIFFTLLNIIDKNKFFNEKGKYVGPILRRYIHPRFLNNLDEYEPQGVLTIEKEIQEIIELIEIFIDGRDIRYWFIDDWIFFSSYYDEIFKYLIPAISEKLNIHFLIVGKDISNFPYYEINRDNCKIPIFDEDFIIKEMAKTFNIDIYKAEKLFRLSQGNWNNAITIYKNNFRNLEEIISENIEKLNSIEKKALFTLTLIGKTFSTATIKAVKELYTPLFFFKNLIDCAIIRWEYPLWRFFSEDILNLIKDFINKEEYQELSITLIDKFFSYKFNDLYDRIAILSQRINDKKRWIYAKLKEFRTSDNLQRKINILKEIIENGEKKDLYLRKLSRLLVYNQRFYDAFEYLQKIERKNLLDLAYLVRSLSYIGEYDLAERYMNQITRELNVNYELPEIIYCLSSYYFLKKDSIRGLRLLNSYLREIGNLRSSPKYLANYYNSLAIQNHVRLKYMDAYHFYNIALDYAKKSNDKQILFRILNNLGSIERAVSGPKGAINYHFQAYNLSKNLSKNSVVVSLANIIYSISQFYPFEKVESYLKDLEDLLKDVKIEYPAYIGNRMLAFTYINYHKYDLVERILYNLKKITNIPENEILIKIIEGILGEKLDFDYLEKKISSYNDEEIIILYMYLLINKEIYCSKILDNIYHEFPILKFIRGLIKNENPISLLKYIDLMMERWEFLDALNSHLLLVRHLEKLKDSSLIHYINHSYFEALNLSNLLKLEYIAHEIMDKISSFYNIISESHMPLKVVETYLQEALISSNDENQAIEIVYRIISQFLDNFLVEIRIGTKSIEKGNYLLKDKFLIGKYEMGPFSIYLYTKEEEKNPLIIFLLRSILKFFIIFWDRIYGIYDPLTQLYNRSYGIKEIEDAFLNYKRDKEEFSIIFLDVDNLKTINDNLGHDYGDYVLQKIAETIRGIIRQNDYAVRWGGDEFLIILKKTGNDIAMKIAERIKDKIREIFEGKLSISYGVESISPDIINYEEVIKRADTKMYAHKVSKF